MAIIPAEEKVFMVSNSTNTTYSGSAALKAMQQWYTMEDVTNTVRPYQVFTALLTQSGESDFVNQTSGTFDIGVTYIIDIYKFGDDFSNIGGPSSAPNGTWDGYSFIATGTTPLSYTQQTSIDHDLGAPVATVLENTIGNIWFTYSDVGSYNINSDGLFTLNKSLGLISTLPLGVGDGSAASLVWQNIDTFKIETGLIAGIPFEGILYNTPIEIRVYN